MKKLNSFFSINLSDILLLKLRKTDVCHYCKHAFSLKRELVKYAADYNFIFENSIHFVENQLKTQFFQIDDNDLNCKLMIQYFEV